MARVDVTTVRKLAETDVIKVGAWFQWFELQLDYDHDEYVQYRLRIGHTNLYIREYSTQVEILRAELDAEGPGVTRWPEGLEVLNGPPKRAQRTKKKAKRRPRRSK